MEIVKKTWGAIRHRIILRKHHKVALFWNDMIQKLIAGKLPSYDLVAKLDLPTNKIIWQYWGQGFEDDKLPAVVDLCFASVDRFKDDFMVIRLDDTTITDFLDLPDFIRAKKASGVINRTFFSDLLRVSLLKVYGGVWLDATVLLTATLPQEFLKEDFFVYQRHSDEDLKAYWENSYAYYWGWHPAFKVKMLNSIVFAKCQHEILSLYTDLLFNYWKDQDKAIDYFFFQILFEQLISSGVIGNRGTIISDVNPHLLQTKHAGGNYPISYKEILERVSIHKLTYFHDEQVIALKEILVKNHKSISIQ